MRLSFRAFVFFFLFFTACTTSELTPVPIENGDMCSFCKMAVSEKRYAAEMIMEDEKVLKFDDIGCMLRFRKTSSGNSNVAATFVMDHDSQQWLKAEYAYFVRSTSIKSPMSSGIIAFGSESNAEKQAENYNTKVLRFNELQVDAMQAK